MNTITQQDLYENYQQAWEEEWLAHVDANLCPTHPSYRRQLKNIQDWVREPASLLDIGCGVGIFSINQARQFPNLQVTAIDLSLPQLITARKLANKYGVGDRIHFINANAEELPLNGLKPDYIVVTEVIEHLLDPAKALKNLRTLCSTNTRLIISVPQIYGDGGAGIFYRQLDQAGKVIVHTQEPRHLRSDLPFYKYYHAEFSPAEICALLDVNGFFVEHLQPIIFKIPIRRAVSNEGSLEKLKRRMLNVVARSLHKAVLNGTNDAFDRVLCRVSANHFAQTLLLVCTVK